MTDQSTQNMSQVEVSFAYDGPAMRAHRMDVQDLAPALLAFGSLLKEANHTVNGEGSTVNVFVKADFENKCFQIHFEVTQTLLQHALGIVMSAQVSGAKEILEWTIAAWDLLKLLKGEKAVPVTSISETDTKGNITIAIPGDNNQVIYNNNVIRIYENQNFRRATQNVLHPLSKPGIEEAVISRQNVENRFSKDDYASIIDSCRAIESDSIEPQIVTALLVVYSPKFDTKAKTWQFKWGQQKITVDISKTNLAQQIVVDNEAHADRHKVEMMITQDRNGRLLYAIEKILETQKSPEQIKFGLVDELDDE